LIAKSIMLLSDVALAAVFAGGVALAFWPRRADAALV
jgi:hypothetical protein